MSSRDDFSFSSIEYFSRHFRVEKPELVPVIFEGHDKCIIPYSFLNKKCFEFVQHVILRYNRVISEIIIEGLWGYENSKFTTFKFECADEIENLEELEKDIIEKDDDSYCELCKFSNRDLENTKSLFQFMYPPYFHKKIFTVESYQEYRECINNKPKNLWGNHIKKLIESFINIEITFRLRNMQLISIKNISHFNIFIKSLHGFGNPKLQVCRLEELFTTCWEYF
ncbi:hypothetical protein NPIL_270041 [Nephila pilipes]|uniref:Uncharacterized protein n=1 Tax=Nephila pilipes TaxID=299642 RepID=A0A8X6UL36_NEPPI|nr:hypothetical protein NPIL_270041 [Nephila pilipes]